MSKRYVIVYRVCVDSDADSVEEVIEGVRPTMDRLYMEQYEPLGIASVDIDTDATQDGRPEEITA